MILSKFVRVIPNSAGYILCHTLNRCIVQIKKTDYLDGKLILNNFSSDEISYLKENDFFSNSTKTYIEQTKNSARNITTITINITEHCNFGCTYCYQNDFESFNILQKSQIHRIIKYVEYVINQGEKNFYIYFFGGEPLLFKPIIFSIKTELDRLISKHNITILYGIGTNAYFLDIDFVSQFDKLIVDTTLTLPKDHDKVRCLKSGKPTFNKILKNITEVSKYSNLVLHIGYNTHHGNINDFEQFLKLLRDNEIDARIGIYYVNNYDFNKEFSNELSYKDFLKWKSSTAISLLIKYGFMIHIFPFTSYKVECDAYNPWSVKFFADGSLGVCNATHYNKRILERSSTNTDAEYVQKILSP